MRQALLEWHGALWHSLVTTLQARRMPHGLLFHGPAGVGKHLLAQQLVEAALCSQPGSDGCACGQCRDCRLLAAGNHPDLRLVAPPEGKAQITIDQIREIGDFFNLKAQYGLHQCVIIRPADQMNENAANSLLKTLEEPPEGALLILVTDRQASISATVRSRCQKILFRLPDSRLTRAWLGKQLPEASDIDALLAQSGGAPLKAAAMGRGNLHRERLAAWDELEAIITGQADPLAVASRWLKLAEKESLYWIYGWTVDMIRIKMLKNPPRLSNPDLQPRLKAVSEKIEINIIYKQLDKISEVIRRGNGPLNQQLLLEDLLIGWRPD